MENQCGIKMLDKTKPKSGSIKSKDNIDLV